MGLPLKSRSSISAIRQTPWAPYTIISFTWYTLHHPFPFEPSMAFCPHNRRRQFSPAFPRSTNSYADAIAHSIPSVPVCFDKKNIFLQCIPQPAKCRTGSAPSDRCSPDIAEASNSGWQTSIWNCQSDSSDITPILIYCEKTCSLLQLDLRSAKQTTRWVWY